MREDRSSSSRAASCSAMTLLETMLALAVLTAGIMAVMGNVAVLNLTRRTVADEARIHALVNGLAERIATASRSDLGVANWSRSRCIDAGDPPAFGRVPMRERAALSEDDLIALGFFEQASGARNLRVFLEYYRGVSTDAATPGVLDAGVVGGGYADENASAAWFARRANRDATRIVDAPLAAVGEGGVVVVRIRVEWDDDGVVLDADGNGRDDDARAIELFTARRL